MSTAVTEKLLTAEEYYLLPDNDRPSELVRGRVVEMNVPFPRHGYYCGLVVRILGNFVEEHDLGRVMSNDSGVITERNPDTVRGADICYFSYDRLPRGPIPEGYLPVAPEVVFEVRSGGDRWAQVLGKAMEYLNAGVLTVCILDPRVESLTICLPDEIPRTLMSDDELTLPEVFGDRFRVPVRRFFE